MRSIFCTGSSSSRIFAERKQIIRISRSPFCLIRNQIWTLERTTSCSGFCCIRKPISCRCILRLSSRNIHVSMLRGEQLWAERGTIREQKTTTTNSDKQWSPFLWRFLSASDLDRLSLWSTFQIIYLSDSLRFRGWAEQHWGFMSDRHLRPLWVTRTAILIYVKWLSEKIANTYLGIPATGPYKCGSLVEIFHTCGDPSLQRDFSYSASIPSRHFLHNRHLLLCQRRFSSWNTPMILDHSSS